jgi:hypothetical protein
VVGLYRRCHFAAISAEEEEKRFQEKVAGELETYAQKFKESKELKTTGGDLK